MTSISRRRFFRGIFGGLMLGVARTWAKIPRGLRQDDLERIDAGPGETIRLLEGAKHGYERLSLILSDSAPGGGPPLHTHECEEVHVVEAGRVAYVLGDERFTLDAPFVMRIPANLPHAFINAGDTNLKITAVFGSPRYTFHFVGPNPFWENPPTKAPR